VMDNPSSVVTSISLMGQNDNAECCLMTFNEAETYAIERCHRMIKE
jgi:hypothetical protein